MSDRDEMVFTAAQLRALGEPVPECIPDDAPTRVSRTLRADGSGQYDVAYIEHRPIECIFLTLTLDNPIDLG